MKKTIALCCLLALAAFWPFQVQAEEPAQRISCASFANFDKLSLRTVSVPDGEMEYMVVGQGRPLLMFCGTGGVLTDWPVEFIKGLCAKRSVILFNYPGTGRSTLTNSRFGWKSIASDVQAVLEDYQSVFDNTYDKADVVAWSLGTLFALKYTVYYPDSVRRLALFASKPGGGAEGNQAYCVYQRYEILANASQYSDAVVDAARKELYELMFPLKEPTDDCNSTSSMECTSDNNCLPSLEASTFYNSLYGGTPDDVLTRQRELVADWNQYGCLQSGPCLHPQGAICYVKPAASPRDDRSMQELTVCDKIRAPVLVVSGTYDFYIRPAYGTLLVDALNRSGGSASWVLRDNAGHGALLQYPEWAAETALNFLGFYGSR